MATLTFPTTQSLLGQAPRVPLRPAEPMAATAATAAVPITSAEETPEQKSAKRYEAAFRNAMLNPNMPIEQQFSTGSARTDAEVLRRAQITTALSNGQAAIQERRNLQAMQAMSPASGVQQVGGTRVAFRNGVPVGIAQDTGVAPQRVQGQVSPSVLFPEQAQANRMRIAELAGQASARDAAARALMGARPAPAPSPVVQSIAPPPVVQPVAPSPVVVPPTFTEALPDDTPEAASMRARQTGLLAPTMTQVPQATVQEAEDISEGATIQAVEEQNRRTAMDLDNRALAAANKLISVSLTGSIPEIQAARQELSRAQSERRKFLASVTPTSFEGEAAPMF